MPDFWLSTIQYVERSVYGFEPLFISSHTTLSLKELLYICSLSCLISVVILKKKGQQEDDKTTNHVICLKCKENHSD